MNEITEIKLSTAPAQDTATADADVTNFPAISPADQADKGSTRGWSWQLEFAGNPLSALHDW
jgi:hypothetical protein